MNFDVLSMYLILLWFLHRHLYEFVCITALCIWSLILVKHCQDEGAKQGVDSNTEAKSADFEWDSNMQWEVKHCFSMFDYRIVFEYISWQVLCIQSLSRLSMKRWIDGDRNENVLGGKNNNESLRDVCSVFPCLGVEKWFISMPSIRSF